MSRSTARARRSAWSRRRCNPWAVMPGPPWRSTFSNRAFTPKEMQCASRASRLALLAHCISFGVNALFEKVDRHGGPGMTAHGLQRRLDQAERLARAVDLDMVEAGWRPTVDNYLGRVTKGRILEAVREARGESSAQLIDHLKKSEMAKEAERLLEGAGWLPEPLRLATVSSPSDDPDSAAEQLPEFLSGNEEESSDSGVSEEPQPVAAE